MLLLVGSLAEGSRRVDALIGLSRSVQRGGASGAEPKKGSSLGGASSSSSAASVASVSSAAGDVLGGRGGSGPNEGPTTWWGIPLDRLPGLQADVDLLNGLLEGNVAAEDKNVLSLYKKLRELGEARRDGDEAALDEMVKIASSMSSEESFAVARVFTHALNLVNVAENHHRFRMIRAEKRENQDHLVREDSFEGTIDRIFDQAKTGGGKVSKEEVYDQLLRQQVEIVLTAHPTEVNRKTILTKYRKISEALKKLCDPTITSFEKAENEALMRRTVASIWGSDEIRRTKPTPGKEAAGGIAVVESVLWDAVPSYCRKLDEQCFQSLGKMMPPDRVPVRFASWIGGDRDGNPNVTPQVTKEVVFTLRLRAAKLLLSDLHELHEDLAISKVYSDEMNALAEKVVNSKHEREKYRRVCGHLRQRLRATILFCEKGLEDLSQGGMGESLDRRERHDVWDDADPAPLFDVDELKETLRVMYDSLSSTGFGEVANGTLKDVMRKVTAFGLTLTPLDIREESDKHTEALDTITQHLGIGSYQEWDEDKRLKWLAEELAGKRPLFRTRDLDSLDFPEGVLKTLRTFEMASTLGPSATGAYVISQARTASDVLAVILLQKQFGMNSKNGKVMRVVPLFETLTDLENAPGVVDKLFSIPNYVKDVKGRQEIMVGYSDSAKDAGRLAACWAQYTAQEKMAAVSLKHKVELTFFHGKGGTVGRGGNPSVYRAVLAHPPNTINGRFRVTEQGEMITQNFGSLDMAERTLDIYTSAVLREAFVDHVKPTEKWRDTMAGLSKVSCDAYRKLVRKEPRFVPYFRQATPELELGILNIGSRPAKRKPKGGIESLRAIPWTFAWTQTRVNLSAWLGCGALNVKGAAMDDLREMYNNWPWFRETIDLVAMVLSKSDKSINKNYDTQLVDKNEEVLGIGEDIREMLAETRAGVLTVTGCSDVTAGFQLLTTSMNMRSPFIDPLNCIQAEVMKRYRTLAEKEEAGTLDSGGAANKLVVEDALRVCIKGIASGMRNSG